MKNTYIYGLLCAMMALTSCIEEQPEIVVPTPGEGVKFYASLNNIETKTIYGDEVYGNGADKPATAIKVNWVDGDMISVYGTTCLPDRNQGQYKVTSEINDDNYSYASNLEMVGDHGVQWGTGEDSKTSDFYAVYPSVAEGAFSKNTDGNIVVSTSIRSEQKNVFVEETTQDNSGNEVTIWSGTPYIDVTNNNVTTKTRTMPDALMYSYTPNVSSGSVVNLNFKPFATVLKFSINGWSSTFNLQDPTVYVQKIILTAPSGVALAGDCTFTFDDSGKPTAKAGSSISNVITINPVLDGADFLPLKRNDKVEFNVFVIPQSNDQLTNNMVLNENWSVRLETTHGNFTFKLTPNVPEGKKAELVAGQIHKIGIPTLMVKSQFTYDPENWIEAIPRNVYLSELSVPGAWYCMNSEYQGNLGFGTTTDITVGEKTIAVDAGLKALHDTGVRAFHFDCRMTLPSTTGSTSGSPNPYEGSEEQKKALKLVVAGTDAGGNATEAGSYKGGTELLTALQSVGALTSSSPKEYTIIVLTIAEKPVSRSGQDYGTVAPNIVLPAIYSVLNSNKNNLPLYINRKAVDSNGNERIINGVDKDVTVNDVLGKMIVVINTNTTQTNFSNFGDVPALLATASMATSADNNQQILVGNFNEMVDDYPLFWSNGSNSVLNYYYHIGQGSKTRNIAIIGTDFPFVTDRQAAVQSVINESHTLWKNGEGAHDSWFLLGIGGYVKNSSLGDADHSALARSMNAYVLSQIQTKLNMVDGNSNLLPSPVGIVLMNFCTSNNTNTTSGNGNGVALVKAIIDMNGKFYLVRNEEAEEWPNN